MIASFLSSPCLNKLLILDGKGLWTKSLQNRAMKFNEEAQAEIG
jgi:hypothetical protein